MDSSKVLKKLEKIVSSATLTKDVTVDGIRLSLRLLTSSEELFVQDTISELDGLMFLLRTKTETLSYAIMKIDDETIAQEVEIEGGIRVQRNIFLKSRFLSSLPQTSIDSIFQAYLVLQLESQEETKKNIKFENAEMIEKYMEEQNLKKAQDTVEKMIDEAR